MIVVGLWLASAEAGQVLAGDHVAVTYNDGGTWNDTSVGSGLQADLGAGWVEFTYPGSPWQQATVEFDFGGAPFAYDANYDHRDWTVLSEADLSTAAEKRSAYAWEAGPLQIRKIESWATDGYVVSVTYEVRNDGTTDIVNLRLMHGFDADQDHGVSGTYETVNDVVDLDGDGELDWAESSGPASGVAVGALACASGDEVGFSAYGSGDAGAWATDADHAFTDDDASSSDSALHWRHGAGDLAPGESAAFTFLLAFGADNVEARAAANRESARCAACDEDGDGALADACGGSDCDDADADVYAGAEEIWYDGIDQDCDGGPDDDQDGDGHGLAGDCDDTNAAVYPGAPGDAWYDGVDTDCSGGSDYDKDGDGYDVRGVGAGDDCDDEDPAVHPDAQDEPYDGLVLDCDGSDENDADGDGHDALAQGGDDCNDADAAVYPGAAEISGDGLDQDCDGSDLVEDLEGGAKCGCASSRSPGFAAALGAALLIRRRSRRR
jgi:hypothetical protein